jgi:hypothetical protein
LQGRRDEAKRETAAKPFQNGWILMVRQVNIAAFLFIIFIFI